MGIFGPNKKVENHAWSTEGRIQDKEYLEMFDQGLCLSIHQPYASLLVTGIKMWAMYLKIICDNLEWLTWFYNISHEGRSWYSSHRGRLWIASAAKVPSSEEISNIEQTYRILKSGW